MPMSEDQLKDVASTLLKAFRECRRRYDRIAGYMRGHTNDIYVPRSATSEYHRLVEQSEFNILPLVVTVQAQNLFVSGYRSTGSVQNSSVWNEVWQPNLMDARQAGLYRAALTYGVSYATVLPGDTAPVITAYSPRKAIALYDEEQDEWPRYAMVVRSTHNWGLPSDPASPDLLPEKVRVDIYDDTSVYHLLVSANVLEFVTDVPIEAHDLGVCPVVRYMNHFGDLDGYSQGEIEPLISPQQQLNQTTFGLLMAQQYAAFKQRWVTGMAIAEDRDGVPVEPFNSAVNRLFQAESPDTKFGEFSETNLSGYLDSRDKTLLFISSIAQIPPHSLLVGSGISNLSAEALVALEAGMRHKIDEKQTSFGESHEQLLRLGGLAAGDVEAWEDTSAQVVWRDTTPRSLAQVADALGKLATQLQIPPRALWERIPGVTDTDIARWENMQGETDILGGLSARLDEPVVEEPGLNALP